MIACSIGRATFIKIYKVIQLSELINLGCRKSWKNKKVGKIDYLKEEELFLLFFRI